MAACGSLPNIFEKPLPEIPTLRQSLSPWKHLNSLEDSSFSLSSSSSSSSSSSPTSSSSWTSSFSSSSFSIDFSPQLGNENLNNKEKNEKKHYRQCDCFSSMNSCTEGLGLENIQAPVPNNGWKCRKARKCITRHTSNKYESVCELKRSKRSRITGEEFPPPISSIGRSGKPWLSLKSYRYNGRFILKEVRIPVQEFLHAFREDGRLKLQIIQSDEEFIEDEEEDYSNENDQSCDHCSDWDEEYNGEKDLGDEDEGKCL